MQELIDEHKYGRKTVKELVEAKENYLQGQTGALEVILDKLNALVNFYPEHIEKEDKVFFPASRGYFTDEEDQAMLAEFWEFDREMIHEKYKSVVEELETQWQDFFDSLGCNPHFCILEIPTIPGIISIEVFP